MALVDHDSWDIEYEGCERLRHQLLVQFNQRSQLATSYASEYVDLTSSIHLGLEQLRKDVSHLKVVLDNAIIWETCTPEETLRRRKLLEKLTLQLQEISAKFKSQTPTNLLPGNPFVSSSDAGASTTIQIPQDMETLRQRQEEMLSEQNRGLDMLSATISRQRQLAMQMGNEVEDHNSILDNLANTMDRVDTRVNTETRNISQVNRRDSTWCYWLVIIALFVAILLVTFI